MAKIAAKIIAKTIKNLFMETSVGITSLIIYRLSVNISRAKATFHVVRIEDGRNAFKHFSRGLLKVFYRLQ